jgi:hypothetical protein
VLLVGRSLVRSLVRSQSVVLAFFLVLPWLMERHAFFMPISMLAYLVLTKKISDTTVGPSVTTRAAMPGRPSQAATTSATSQHAGDDSPSFSSCESAASMRAVSAKVEVVMAFREPDPTSREKEQVHEWGSA